MLFQTTLKSGIDVRQGVNVEPETFDNNSKCRAFNKCRTWDFGKNREYRAFNKPRKFEKMSEIYQM
jgi:hypothetical protein